MTRLLTTGFETGDVNEAGVSTINSNHTISVVGSTPTPRAGAYCLKVLNSSTAFGATYKTFALAAAKTEIWARWAVFIHGFATASNEFTIAVLQDASATAQASVTWTVGDGLLRAYRGSATTLLAAGGTALPQDSWHVIEIREQILSATTGVMEVWLDGNQIINFSGDVANTATLNVQTLQLGAINSFAAQIAGSYMAIDDLAINDVAGSINNARPGDGRVILLSPNGAGTTTQLVRGGTDTGANYSQVNELPPSITQYVGSATVGERDLYALPDIGIAVSSINVVEEILLAQNSDAGGGSLAPTVKSGATTNEATALGLTTSPGYITGRWETNPDGGAAWTVGAVNALEAGATVR